MVKQSLFYLREYFFPSGCGGCGKALHDSRNAYYGLCENCRTFINSAFAGERRCEICDKPLISERRICLSCRPRGADSDGDKLLVKVRTFFPYTGKFRAILGAYKFEKSLGVGNFLIEYLSSSADNFSITAADEAAWVPVPPRPGKIKKQGWDQIEYLAGLLERAYTSFSVRRCLKRLPSRSQKELNREQRGSNLKGRVIRVGKPPKTAILFDDVITTGATMNACAGALLEGGTEKVYGVCLFYD